MATQERIVFYLFYKITRIVEDGVCDGVQWPGPFHVFHTVMETRLLAYESSRFQNVIL